MDGGSDASAALGLPPLVHDTHRRNFSDGPCAVVDSCPSDPLKQSPGVCGCGVSDADTEADGTPDCLDGCPLDGTKVAPGICGCGVPDTDSDQDGVADCNDLCALDGTKVVGGTCGCGVPDIDSDGDGTFDCADSCPLDAAKLLPGACGCGVADVDADEDGSPDCLDGCPLDPLKLNAGLCGCGVADADSDADGVADCNDGCPLDPTSRQPGPCGCGSSNQDNDSDGAPDCLDPCPDDPLKTEAGVCGCGVPEVDADLDGVPDCLDPCPLDPTRSKWGPCGAGPAHVDLTWMTVTNMYAEMGPLDVLIDGYITRIPRSNFFGGGGGLQNTHTPNTPDIAMVTQVLSALGGPQKVSLLLTGHSHFDHAFDTATWASLTNAPIIGSKTTCYQAIAQGVPAARCTEVLGGEKITLTDGVTLRVIRWNHSGDSSNPEQHDPVELEAVPHLDPVTGGLRAGVGEDFPNGGGGRALLFSIDGVEGPYSWLFVNSGGVKDLDAPIVVDGVDYGAPLENLKAALADAGLDSVDLLVGPSSNGGELAKIIVPIARPKAYIPVHWDDFYAPFLSRPRAFNDNAFITYLTQQKIKLLAPAQVMDKWRLSRAGTATVANPTVKQALRLQ